MLAILLRYLRAIALLAGALCSAAATLPARAVADFAWPGTYDVRATGFPDGDRHAVMLFTRRDSTYEIVALEGPPGGAVYVRVERDSAHVIWDLDGRLMALELRGAGDSLTGHWYIDDVSGEVRGRRR